MRDLGLYDDAGTLIAVANMAGYKPALAEGSGRSQTCPWSSSSAVASVGLTIDTTTVMATQDYVDDKIAEHEQSTSPGRLADLTKGFTPVKQCDQQLHAKPQKGFADPTVTAQGLVARTNSTSESNTKSHSGRVMDETAAIKQPQTGTPTVRDRPHSDDGFVVVAVMPP